MRRGYEVTESATMIAPDARPRHSPRIGAVIPYFQRAPGLLRRALSSVAHQAHPPAQVVVVDDGSPRAAAEEITPSLRDALPGLTVVNQANRGIAAARNAALDALGDDVSAVALLDSDDYWEPTHLRNAATALSLGADFYFANSRVEGGADYFDEHPRRDLLYHCQPVPGGSGIRRWSGSVSALFGAGCVFATPAVVFRRDTKPDLRFPVQFRRAGEDQVAFWELLLRASEVMFCLEPTVVIGSGGLGTWRNATLGSVQNLVRLADEIRMRRHVLNTCPVSPEDRCQIQGAIAWRRQAALQSVLHLLRRRRNVLREVLYLMQSDPLCAASWCVDLPKFVYRYYTTP
jgi:succinoglycan biosynthesis protein ExoW